MTQGEPRMSGIEWLTTAEVAAITKRAESEIRRALRSRELVGEQRSPRSHYRIDRRAVDAWIRGERFTERVTTGTKRRSRR